jgi:hypothetical protein|tara:strand:+ start:254 stop:403 length:150 start_codon:yes stop_codon:yes gene_type:complete
MGGVGDGCVDVFGSVRRVFREFRFALGDSFGCYDKKTRRQSNCPYRYTH